MASNGTYGIRIGANVNPQNDVEIYYSYSATRNSDDINSAEFIQLDSSLLTKIEKNNIGDGYDTTLEGLYNIKLPLTYFNQKGFYTVYIKPREIPVVLLDVGVLSSYPDVKGLIIDTTTVTNENGLQTLIQTNNALVGYRVIYFDDKGKRQDYYRIITSNNKCEPVVENLTDVNQKAVRYRYNDNSTLSFITVTPSASSTFKPNAEPYIGRATQKVVLVNTKFEPIMLDIEMTDHDADTISTMLEGSQLRDLDNGIITTFNKDNEIYHQSENYTLKNEYTNVPIYEVKKNKTESIDYSQTLDDKA